MKHLDKFDTARPYTACFVLLREGNKVAMVLRKNTGWMDGYYGLPAGRKEYKETFRQGAVREAKEEAGVDIAVDHLTMAHTCHHYAEQDGGYMEWVDVYFEVKEWQGKPHNAEPDKSERLEWLDLNNLPENVVASQLAALVAIAQGIKYSEHGWV